VEVCDRADKVRVAQQWRRTVIASAGNCQPTRIAHTARAVEGCGLGCVPGGRVTEDELVAGLMPRAVWQRWQLSLCRKSSSEAA
jgi:hypothetical protein